MASDTEKCKIIAAIALDGMAVAIDIPDTHREFWNWFVLEDNGFTRDSLPKEPGVYELECELFWDDGISIIEGAGEANDMPVIQYTVKRSKPLWKLKTDKGRR